MIKNNTQKEPHHHQPNNFQTTRQALRINTIQTFFPVPTRKASKNRAAKEPFKNSYPLKINPQNKTKPSPKEREPLHPISLPNPSSNLNQTPALPPKI